MRFRPSPSCPVKTHPLFNFHVRGAKSECADFGKAFKAISQRAHDQTVPTGCITGPTSKASLSYAWFSVIFRHLQQHIDFGPHHLGAIGHDAFSPPIFCPSPVSLPLLWPWLCCLPHGTEDLVRCTFGTASSTNHHLFFFEIAQSCQHRKIKAMEHSRSVQKVQKLLGNGTSNETSGHNNIVSFNCEFQKQKAN